MTETDMLTLLEICALTGKILLENGSGTTQTEQMMRRIALQAKVDNIRIFTSATGVFVGVEGEPLFQMESVSHNEMDLEKINFIYGLVAQYEKGAQTLSSVKTQLQQIDQKVGNYKLWLKLAAVAINSATLMYIFEGDLSDFFVTCFVAVMGYLVYAFLNRFLKIDFISNGVAAFVIAVLAMFAAKHQLAMSQDAVIIGSLMPLVPGVKMANAFSDAINGQTISSLTSGTQAFLTASSIAVGVALALHVKV